LATIVSGSPSHPDVTIDARIACALKRRRRQIDFRCLPDPEALACRTLGDKGTA
jgi:hypothetical protein